MFVKFLRLTLFVPSMFVVGLTVVGCSNEIENKTVPIGETTGTHGKKKIVIQNGKKEPEDTLLTDETGTSYNKMSKGQIAQIKRYDCRLREQLISHSYYNE